MDYQTLPKMHQVRLILDNPTQSDLYNALLELREAGVSPDAKLRFTPWNMPPNRWYLIASWLEMDDGSTAPPHTEPEFVTHGS